MLVALPPLFCRQYLDTSGKEIPGSKGAVGREYIDLLFKIESEIKELSPKKKKQKRQEASKPILDAFWSWVDETAGMYTENKKLTEALTYCKNQRKNLESAKANNLDAYEYLKYLLEEMPNNHYLEQPDILERYLPWSEELPECFRLKQRHKKMPQTMMWLF